jgi:hypothetical protein
VLVQLIFERFNCHSYYVAESPVLSLYAANRTTGVVVDAGHGRLGEYAKEPPLPPPIRNPVPVATLALAPLCAVLSLPNASLRAMMTCTPRKSTGVQTS